MIERLGCRLYFSTKEDEPEFAQFLAFVAKDALSHPEKLGDMAELLEGNEDLYDGVPIE